MPKCRFTKFHLDKIPSGSNILIVGRRGVGKSHLCIELLLHKPNTLPIIFCSKYVALSFRKKLPEAHVFDHFDANKLEQLLDMQVKNQGAIDVTIAFDDITHNNACLMQESLVRDLVKYGSSLRLTSIFSVQHAGVYDDTFRRNVDYVFAFHDNLVVNKRILYERYGDMFPSFETFNDIFISCTSSHPHWCLVMNMASPWVNATEVDRKQDVAALEYDDNNAQHMLVSGVSWYESSHDNLTSLICPAPWKEDEL